MRVHSNLASQGAHNIAIEFFGDHLDSGTDWVEGGWDLDQTIAFAKALAARGCSAIHVSSGGMTPAQKIPVGPSYQVPLARAVKAATNLPTVAVGLIAGYDQAEAIIGTGDADFVALASIALCRACGSAATPMMRSSTARVRRRRNSCYGELTNASENAASNCIRTRHGSCTARISIASRIISKSSSLSWDIRSGPARSWTNMAGFT
jgi:hypothetical protein